MSEDGYTLAEMLAALAMIALAIGGLTQGVHVLGRAQASANRAVETDRNARSTQIGLERLFDGQGPFTSDSQGGLSGSPTKLSFACAGAGTCQASLSQTDRRTWLSVSRPGVQLNMPLPGNAESARFTYGGPLGPNATWPPTATRRQSLQWVALSSGEDPLATVRLWSEEPRRCVFDVISQDCRSAPS